MLFLYHRNFHIESASEIRPLIERADVHIIVHSLLFRRRYYSGLELRERIGGLVVYSAAHVVERMTVFCDRRSAGHYLRIAADELFAEHALFHFEQIAVAVEVVEVLEQRKVERLFDVSVTLAPRHQCRKIYGKLLVCDSRLENGLVYRLEIAYTLLLLLVASSYESYLSAQLVVRAMAGKVVIEAALLELRAVHENYSHFRIRVYGVLVVGFGVELFPIIEPIAFLDRFLV